MIAAQNLKFVSEKDGQNIVEKGENAGNSIFSFSLNVFNPFPNKPWFLHICSTSLLKTMWEKEKLLITSNFSFSHSVFYPFEELSSIFNVFNPFLNKPWFLHVCSTSLLKTMCEKEKLLITSNFSFSHIVFYPYEEISSIFIKFEIVICKFFQFGRV